LTPVSARLREGECEVCLKSVDDFKAEVKTMGDTGSSEADIEKAIKRVCKRYTTAEEKRFCYYIGGSVDAATYLLGSISPSIRNHLPNDLICDKLKKLDPAICNIKYQQPEKSIDYSTLDYDKLRVKELKDIIRKWGEECVDCVEKSDFIRLIKQVLPKYTNMNKATTDTKEL